MTMSMDSTIRNLAQFLTKTSTYPAIEAEKESTGRFLVRPGQQVQAEILANLPNHRTLVRVAGELMKMELPVTVRPGDTLPMTFLAEEPRLTFALSRSANSSSPVYISDTGKMLGMLAGKGVQPQVSSLPRSNIVLDGPPADTASLAARLRETLTFSGIFYESHLVQWSQGERSMKDILREPQGKSTGRGETGGSAKSARNQAHRGVLDALLGTNENIPDETIAAENGAERKTPVEPEMLPILKEQMQTLHSGQFVWQGEVWPGQEMEWTVRERETESGEKQDRELETTLRLELPNLGEVSATLRLTGDGLSLHMMAAGDNSAAAMQSDRQGLADAMSAAGIRLAGMVIDHGQDGSGE